MVYIPNQNCKSDEKTRNKIIGKKDATLKKYNLIVELRVVFKNNDRARTFP